MSVKRSITRNTCGCMKCKSCKVFIRHRNIKLRYLKNYKPKPKQSRFKISKELQNIIVQATPARRARLIGLLAKQQKTSRTMLYNWLKQRVPGWSDKISNKLKQFSMESHSQ